MNSIKSAAMQQAGMPSGRIPLKLAGMEDEANGTNQEEVPAKYLAGRCWVAGHYITPQYNGHATPAPEEARGKK